MIDFPNPARFSDEIKSASPDVFDWPFLSKKTGDLPPRFGKKIVDLYKGKREASQFDANRWLDSRAAALACNAVSLASSDDEICARAKALAREVSSELASFSGLKSSDELAVWVREFIERHGAKLPEKNLTLQGLIGRATDEAFWRRNLRKTAARKVESVAIELGFVHRRAGLYASDEACARREEQGALNRRILEASIATNQDGYSATLAELSDVGISNPAIRRGELMTRIRGFEDFAKLAGHVGMFYTATAPGRMHARLSVSGAENPKYDGTLPRDCAAYLQKTWAKARAWLDRRDVRIYGFRVAEPHHDGTPHWHMLFFMGSDVVELVTHCLRKYFCEMDAHELQTDAAARARFEVVRIDWQRGSAAGYIAKYIAKNIDGKKSDGGVAGDDFEAEKATSASETAPRVLAWSSVWGIRQFAQIGGPGVTVWRELRRVREMQHQGDLFAAWSSADGGDWCAFVKAQGGVEIKQKDRPVQLLKVKSDEKNKYGEERGDVVVGVCAGSAQLQTRVHVWDVKRAGVSAGARVGCRGGGVGVGFEVGRASGPWSSVNNCTRRDADGFELGSFAAEAKKTRELSREHKEQVTQARRDAWRVEIKRRRVGGAFGRFPAPPGAKTNGQQAQSGGS